MARLFFRSSSSAVPAKVLSASQEDKSLFAERERRDRKLRAYIESSKKMYQEACVRNQRPNCGQVMSTIAAKCDKISGLDRAALKKYHTSFGCTKPTAEAIRLIRERRRSIVEMGAGNGHWQTALAKVGVRIRSFDDMSKLPLPQLKIPESKVEEGGVEKLQKWSRHTFDLLLVYPPPANNFALQCAKSYRGDAILYVGEPRGGANANDDFFDYLEAHFSLSTVLELEPFPGGCERLYILRRASSP